jgi:hypothetical protein
MRRGNAVDTCTMRRSTDRDSPSHDKPTDNEMTEQLEFRERVYHSFPAPLMKRLLRRKGVGKPTAVIESIEGSTGVPGFEKDDFGAVMKDMDDLADRATEKLSALGSTDAETGLNGNGNGSQPATQ